MVNVILAFLIGLYVGYSCGWSDAHATVARECRLLGGFYVGRSVFRCVEEARPEPGE